MIGGIIGLGEAEEDRVGLLHTLATLPTHPESVPINSLVAVKGTPLQDQKVTLILLNSETCEGPGCFLSSHLHAYNICDSLFVIQVLFLLNFCLSLLKLGTSLIIIV